MKKTMKKSTKGFLNNLITYAIVIIAFVFTQMALSKMIPGVTISRSLKGQLIVQSAGDAVRISWKQQDMEALCDVLAQG